MEACCDYIQNDIIGTDAGNRGMKPLIVPGDLFAAAQIVAQLGKKKNEQYGGGSGQGPAPVVVLLSGFPCCVTETPPTETDGPPGTCSIARTCLALGYHVTICTDQCNEAVFAAAMKDIPKKVVPGASLTLRVFRPDTTISADEVAQLKMLGRVADCIIACERAGPGRDGICYTMRGINMNAAGLIAPLHQVVAASKKECPFIAIGDGGNELGMGKVYDTGILHNALIPDGALIGCTVAADHLIAASVSNWGGYALSACTALVAAAATYTITDNDNTTTTTNNTIEELMEKFVPSDQDEIALLKRCVQCGCRDGVSGRVEATVDGMPLETSLQCLRDIRQKVLSSSSLIS